MEKDTEYFLEEIKLDAEIKQKYYGLCQNIERMSKGYKEAIGPHAFKASVQVCCTNRC